LDKSIAAPIKYLLGLAVDAVVAGKKDFYRDLSL
jgi:hypothetical protein